MTERTYIENDNARITRGEGILLKVEMYDGRVFEDVEARRLFPVTGVYKYITLLDSEGAEQAVIRDLRNLTPDSRAVVEEVLGEYYLVPKITQIEKIINKKVKIIFHVITDNGPREFEVKSIYSDIKTLYDGRVLIKDSNDNRCEISNLNALSRDSQRLMAPYL